MHKTFNVLIVEDEPLIVSSLKSSLDYISNSGKKWDFRIKTARNCDDALLQIDNAVRNNPFDLAILDVNIPHSKDHKYISGEDLGAELRRFFPNIKIIVFTSHSENFRLGNILQSVKPNGLLVKNDVDFNDLVECMSRVLNEIPFYSKTVLKLIRSQISNTFTLDRIDRLLLHQISLGTRTKNLPEIVGLSKSGIESRKRKLKEVFCLEKGDDKDLLDMAKEKGFI